MRILTAAQMRALDRATMDIGIPGLILMETAAARCVEYISEHFGPVRAQRIAVVCGKGNNGGDGLAIARQLHVRHNPAALHVILACDPVELSGDAAQNLAMLRASGLTAVRHATPEMASATLVIDAILGTGTTGPARGEALDAIRTVNSYFPSARILSVDLPSGLDADSGAIPGEFVRADATVTFTAPKPCHVLPPAANHMGDLKIVPIGSPASLFEHNPELFLELVTPRHVAPLFAKRPTDSNKGRFGHVLIVAGSRGKSGAAAMAGLAALRAGAGLVTVACPESVLPAIAGYAPELMTEPLPETASGALSRHALEKVLELASTRTVVAAGPGIGLSGDTRELILNLFQALPKPLIVDADALNCLAGERWSAGPAPRILTPHPGEMGRLTGLAVPEIQTDRVSSARAFATEHKVILVLKGERTVTALGDGRVFINPTGCPALATAGTGDILTGILSGLLAQFPDDPARAATAAVYLHGLAGELASASLSEQSVIATDLLHYLHEGIRAIANN